MCFGRDPVLGIQPVLFSLSGLLTETSFSVSFSLSKNQLSCTTTMQSSPELYAATILNPAPTPLTHPADKGLKRLPTAAGSSAQKQWKFKQIGPLESHTAINTAGASYFEGRWHGKVPPGILSLSRETDLSPDMRRG